MTGVRVGLWLLLISTGTSDSVDYARRLRAITAEITGRDLGGFRCVTYITDDEEGPAPPWAKDRVRQAVVIHLRGDVRNHSRLILFGYEESCSGFVIRVSRTRRTTVLREMIRAYKGSLLGRYNDKRYLVLAGDEGDNGTDFLDSHDMYYMPNLVFAAASGDGFAVYGHNYFHGHKYDVLNEKHELLDEWSPVSGFKTNRSLYPNKLVDLHGKVVRFSTVHFSPFALVVPEGNGTVFDGLETRIAAQFVESSNGTWTAEDNPVDLWGAIYSNGTGIGLFGSVLGNTADMGFAAIYQWYCAILECSYPYIYSEVTCLAPKPDPVSGWMTIVLPFAGRTWMALFINYLLVSFFVFAMNLLWNKMEGSPQRSSAAILVDSFTDTFRLQLEQVPAVAHKKTPVSYFLKTWTVYCFFIAVFWQGGIASFLTTPRYGETINNVGDLLSRFPKLQWGANHNAWTKSIENATDPNLRMVVQNFVVQNDATLKDRAAKKDFAYFIERLQNGHYGLNDYIDRDGIKHLRIMDEYLYSAYCVTIMTRGSPYQERMNEMVHRMTDTGLILKMEVQVSLERIDNKLQNMVRTSSDHPSNPATKLSVSHVHGAIFIYVSGVALSFVAFAIELWYR